MLCSFQYSSHMPVYQRFLDSTDFIVLSGGVAIKCAPSLLKVIMGLDRWKDGF